MKTEPTYFGRGDETELSCRIRLLNAPGIGPVRSCGLLRQFGSAKAIFRASDGCIAQVKGVGSSSLKALSQVRQDRDPVSRDAKSAQRNGYRLLASVDRPYPDLLSEVYDNPALLWVFGDVSILSLPTVAVVGTRKATPSGLNLAYSLAYDLSRAGVVVVSGLAYGIDRKAHEGALDAGGKTVAVLGSGLDHIYPSMHRRLADRIAVDGAVVSEFPLTMPPEPGHFPRRNRIVSGLSLSTVVVESHIRGGALLTARQALDQNRDVYAYPGSPGISASAGTNQLIQRGEAKLLTSALDILDDLLDRGILWPPAGGCLSEQDGMEGGHRSEDPDPGLVSGIDKRILDHLSTYPKHVDTIANESDIAISTLLVRLLQLEYAGFVRQLPGKNFVTIERASRIFDRLAKK